jgi:hypothetical protein
MNATTILAELLIVGIQGTSWLLFFIFSVFGYRWTYPVISSLKGWEALITIILIAFCYTLGIFIDRFSDAIFSVFSPKKLLLKSNWIKNKAKIAVSDSRIFMLLKENKVEEYLQYIRHRIRIARSTAINMFLITITLILFLFSRVNDLSAITLILIFISGLLISFISFLLLGVLELTQERRMEQIKLYYKNLEI